MEAKKKADPVVGGKAKAEKASKAQAESAKVAQWDPTQGLLTMAGGGGTKALTDKEKDPNVVFGVRLGSTFQKDFPGHGTFTGTVVAYLKDKKYFSVKYEDGDTEEIKVREQEDARSFCLRALTICFFL